MLVRERTRPKPCRSRHTPDFIFRHAEAVWKQFYDSGRVELASNGAASARFRIHGFATPARELCVALAGWIERSLELVGTREVRVEELECAAEGAERCDFRISWAEPVE